MMFERRRFFEETKYYNRLKTHRDAFCTALVDPTRSISSSSKILSLPLSLSLDSNETKKNKILLNYKYLEKEIVEYLKRYKLKDVVELMSAKEKVSKKIIYKLCLKNKK